MTAAGVLVVTPYNNQAGLLWAVLPGARIGTPAVLSGIVGVVRSSVTDRSPGQH